MNDRTAYIVSTILHLAVFLYLTINLRSHYQYMPGSYITMAIAQGQTTPPPATPKKTEPEPKPEPEPPKPQKIEKKPPKLTEDTISQLREKLSSTPTKKPTAKPAEKNTPTPRPTAQPTPPPKRTPTPRPAVEQPTPTPDLPRIPLSEIDQAVTAPSTSNASIASVSGTYTTQIIGDPNAPHDFTGYAMILNKQLYRAWLQPTIRPPEYRDFITVVSFTVYQDGSISDIFLEESSGWPALDKSVLEAVQRASPLERLPMTYTASSVRVLVPFIMPKKTF